MKLYEYQAKEIFARTGIPVPRGRVVLSPEEAAQAAGELGGEVVIKAQVLAGGRGKAGGVRFAAGPEETAAVARTILDLEIKGLPVNALLVEERLPSERELYLSISVDRQAGRPVILAAAEGGMEIETFPEDKIRRRFVETRRGVHPWEGRELAAALGLRGSLLPEFGKFMATLALVFERNDAELAEINPLVQVGSHLVAADARLNIDDAALFRHPDLTKGQELGTQGGPSFVRLGGDIAVLANGAGMAMATLDVLESLGGKASCFIDLGGGTGEEEMSKAIGILGGFSQAMLVNIFGGITRCDEVARAVIRGRQAAPQLPLVVRLDGTNQEEGLRLLREAGVAAVSTMEEAARQVVAQTGGKGEKEV